MRDLRDPQKLGEVLSVQAMHVRDHYGADISLSEIYDLHVSNFAIPEYPKHDSVGTQTAREYRRELKERAEAGDRYAASMLKGLPYDEPGDMT